MKPLIPYLLFNATCREAMTFYQDCFGGELELMTYGDSPEGACDKKADKNEIMHACLRKDSFILMASDWPSGEAKQGNNVHLNIDCSTKSEIETLFKKLSEDGTIVQPLADTFWGAHFGMLIDKYNIHWMLNYSLKQ
ncbi:VOC family protein [Legionella sp. PATHC032]|uniref:VOC family protein n=1 Tax=Legionella sp. PATHC032 TaxID=2992039 RepID=UPI001B075DC3|nr:VOC family protein [Legionella sp. PATHC032]MCW8422388.1 VOC family protein [Legionella sp. PATHC032]HAZ7573673.1 VOC family protein [Legionella pneumophila]HBA1635846.1 VOC family protein [Legionella pneumophila]